MTIYVIDIILIFLVFSLPSQKVCNDAKLYCIFFLLFFTAALRGYTVGADTAQYYFAYKHIDYQTSRYEIGFKYLIRALNYISDNPQALIATTSLLYTGSFFCFIKKYSKNLFLSSYLYITLLEYAYCLNLMRQAIAISILLLSVKYLKYGKVYFVTATFAASLFHLSALLFLIFLPLSLIKYTKNVFSIYVLLFLSAALIPSHYYSGIVGALDYSTYLSSAWGGTNYIAAPIMTCLYFILMIVAYYAISKKRYYNDDVCIFLHGTSLLIVFQAMAIQLNIVQRVVPYFMPFLLIMVPNALNLIENKLRMVLLYSIIIVSFIFFVVVMIYRPEWTGIVPYTIFFDY